MDQEHSIIDTDEENHVDQDDDKLDDAGAEEKSGGLPVAFGTTGGGTSPVPPYDAEKEGTEGGADEGDGTKPPEPEPPNLPNASS